MKAIRLTETKRKERKIKKTRHRAVAMATKVFINEQSLTTTNFLIFTTHQSGRFLLKLK